ncbi:hypothetical protein V1478_015322 [Vespula squamosa]|uniref:Uncharacterized protein n=1 Tax=Vespula squamosa TaxID=30214 RepID=A0ABD2A4S2_VESSQ
MILLDPRKGTSKIGALRQGQTNKKIFKLVRRSSRSELEYVVEIGVGFPAGAFDNETDVGDSSFEEYSLDIDRIHVSMFVIVAIDRNLSRLIRCNDIRENGESLTFVIGTDRGVAKSEVFTIETVIRYSDPWRRIIDVKFADKFSTSGGGWISSAAPLRELVLLGTKLEQRPPDLRCESPERRIPVMENTSKDSRPLSVRSRVTRVDMHRPANNPSIGVVGDDDHIGSGRRSRGPRNTSYDFTSSLYHDEEIENDLWDSSASPVSLVPEVLDFVTVRFLRERGLDSARVTRIVIFAVFFPILFKISVKKLLPLDLTELSPQCPKMLTSIEVDLRRPPDEKARISSRLSKSKQR